MQTVFKMKKTNNQNNMMSLMMTILECYKGGYNCLRQTVVRHCLNLVAADVFKEDQMRALNYWNLKLQLVSNWEQSVR